jgi:exosortase
VSTRAWTRFLCLREPAVLAFAVLGGLGVFAYRALFSYDPSVGERYNEAGDEVLFEPAGGSPLLVFAVLAWLIWRRRGVLQAALGAPAFVLPAALCLLPALALLLWAHYVDAPDLLFPSLMLLLPGVGGLLGGRVAFRALLLPALFLVFALPVPADLLNQVLFPLQLATAQLTQWLLGLIGISSILQGDQILTGQKIFQVIETCSGLRLMQTLTMAALVYGELLSRSRLHRVVLVLLAPLVGVAVNAARVLSIVLNPYSEFAGVHTTQGIAMLLVGVLIVAGIDWLLERALPETPVSPSVAAAPGPLPRRRLAAACLGLALLGCATLWLPVWGEPPVQHRTLSDFPLRIGEWRSQSVKVDRTFLGSVSFSERTFRSYRRGGEEIRLFVGLDSRLDPRVSFLSGKVVLPGTGWEVVERRPASDLPGPQAELLWVRSRAGERLVLYWTEGVAGPGLETLRAFLSLDRGPLRRPGVAKMVRLSTPLRGGAGARASAEGRLRSFAPIVRQALAALERGERPRLASASAVDGRDATAVEPQP